MSSRLITRDGPENTLIRPSSDGKAVTLLCNDLKERQWIDRGWQYCPIPCQLQPLRLLRLEYHSICCS